MPDILIEDLDDSIEDCDVFSRRTKALLMVESVYGLPLLCFGCLLSKLSEKQKNFQINTTLGLRGTPRKHAVS